MTDRPLELHCETPVDAGVRLAFEDLEVAGWARGPDPVSAVEVDLGGHRAQADVTLDEPDGAARFHARLPLHDLPRGPTVLTIHARDTADREVSLRSEIDLQPFNAPNGGAAQGPLVICDQPRLDLSEPLETPGLLVGWAYAPEGIDRVLVVIDRRTAHDAVTKLWRGDVARELGRPDATDSGWLLELPEGVCPPGEHEIAVIAIAHGGRATGRVGIVIATDPEAPGMDPPRPNDDVATQGHHGQPRERAAGELETPAEYRALMSDLERSAVYSWVGPFAHGAAILDLGCGDELGRERLQQSGAAKVVGLDQRPIGAALPYDDRSFDLILALERDYDPTELAADLPELRRALRPEGVLVVAGHGVGRVLSEEFPHVTTAHRRLTLVAEVTEADASSDLPRPDVHGDDAEVAAASHNHLPGLPRAVVHRGPVDLEPWRTLAATWTERALRAEAELEAVEIDAASSQHHAQLIAIRLLESEREREALAARLKSQGAREDS